MSVPYDSIAGDLMLASATPVAYLFCSSDCSVYGALRGLAIVEAACLANCENKTWAYRGMVEIGDAVGNSHPRRRERGARRVLHPDFAVRRTFRTRRGCSLIFMTRRARVSRMAAKVVRPKFI